MVTFQGRWRVSVIGKDSDWPQRVNFNGAGVGPLSGVIGQSTIVDSPEWTVTVEHDDGSGWSPNAVMVADAMAESGMHLSQVVRTKDQVRPGDAEPNDLVLWMEKVGPAFAVVNRPCAADAATMMMLADGVFININGHQLMGVTVRNTWGRAWHSNEFMLDISTLGRATLASFGVDVIDAWPPAVLAATGGRTIPALEVGEQRLLFFLVDTSGARKGKPRVEFRLDSVAAAPDPANAMRFNHREIFLAEVSFDPVTATSTVTCPEGKLTFRPEAIAVDRQALQQLCREVSRTLDPATLAGKDPSQLCRELFQTIYRCICHCDDHKGGLKRSCQPGGIWLPIRFEYSVELTGGYTGQHGPLAFQDPWWKVLLLILALIAWLVGAIAAIVAAATGLGNTGDHSKKIGTVGNSNRATTDAAIIEFDGSRPAIQDVVDAIVGETNMTPISTLSTLIAVDPQVAIPDLTTAVGQLVYKSGARTGLTHGIISSVATFTQCRGDFNETTGACTPDANHPDLVLPNQFYIGADAAFGEELFDDHGDSGSIVLSRQAATMHQVVGLLHSGSGGTSPIQDVLAALDLKLR